MDNKNIEKKIHDTFLKALKNTNAPFEPDGIDMETCNLDLEKSVHLKVKAGFGKNAKPNPAIVEASAHRQSESLSVAMVYQNRPIGEIEIIIRQRDLDLEQVKSAFEQVASEMTFFVKRQQVQREIEQSRKLNVEWIGTSDLSRQVDRFVERASLVDFPVLIRGEIGSGKLITAYSIHCHSVRKKNAFIESHCANWQDSEITATMRSLWSRASGGTLYLKDIDALKPKQIARIRHYWRHIVNSDQGRSATVASRPRLIASISGSGTSSSQQAWRELDYLSIELPNLRERREDIKELTEHYLEKLSHIKNVQLSAECWDLFERFNWAGNMHELERLVSKLVVMSDSNYLEPNALLAIIPQLKDSSGADISLESDNNNAAKKLNIENLATSIAEESYQANIDIHPALGKAISFLAKNYTRDISLNEISNASFVSSSHLSYLFKHHINSTFKQLLIQTRIEKAKHLLLEKKHVKITEVAYDVGFHDLSHFEKTFKRLVGLSPGKFRK